MLRLWCRFIHALLLSRFRWHTLRFLNMFHHCFVVPSNRLVLCSWPPESTAFFAVWISGSSFLLVKFHKHLYGFQFFFHLLVFHLKHLRGSQSRYCYKSFGWAYFLGLSFISAGLAIVDVLCTLTEAEVPTTLPVLLDDLFIFLKNYKWFRRHS